MSLGTSDTATDPHTQATPTGLGGRSGLRRTCGLRTLVTPRGNPPGWDEAVGEAGAGWTATHTRRPRWPRGAGLREGPAHAGNMGSRKPEAELPSSSLDPETDGGSTRTFLAGCRPHPSLPLLGGDPALLPSGSHAFPPALRASLCGPGQPRPSGGLRGGGVCRRCSLAGSEGHSGGVGACPLSDRPCWNGRGLRCSRPRAKALHSCAPRLPAVAHENQAVSEGGRTPGPTRMRGSLAQHHEGELSSSGWGV